ncbi:MAG TPA: T9SS type A sorting domain-containing protein [Candidatus Cloacimonadota bacterium]|nr:T9SS type A sorting domain-containing protein [Candidatus Cloacimonadota bacterium]
MKYITLIVLLLGFSILAADPTIYPTTSLVENFGATWCDACESALDGLDVIANDTQPGEVIFTRLLTESGEYSSPQVEGRFFYYDVQGLPAVIFNGKTRVDGSGEGIADGSQYHSALNNSRFLGSNLKMQIPSFVPATGNMTLNIELLNPEISISDAKLVYYLIEDNIDDELTHILRYAYIQDFAIAYTGEALQIDYTFDIDDSWNAENLWAVAFVQSNNKSILQSASSQEASPYLVQAALPMNILIHGNAGGQYVSPAFYIYNLGLDDSYTRHIEVIDAPADWYFNYCDVDGNCYPGSIQIPFSLAAGESVAYDLNLTIGSPGVAHFDFVISSSNIGEYRIPFTFTTSTSNSDALAPASLNLVQAYPNPFRDNLSLQIESLKDLQDTTLQVFNLKGQQVRSLNLQQIRRGTNNLQIDLKDLPNGVYFYKLRGSSSTGKLLKIQ